MAALSKNAQTVQLILAKNKSIINAKNADGLTPVFFAAMYGTVAIIEELHRNGADMKAHVRLFLVTPLTISGFVQ